MHAFAVSETASGAGGYWPLAPVCFCNTSQSGKKWYGFATQRTNKAGEPILRFSRSIFRLLYAGFCPRPSFVRIRSPQSDALAKITVSAVPLRSPPGWAARPVQGYSCGSGPAFSASPRHTAPPAADARPCAVSSPQRPAYCASS